MSFLKPYLKILSSIGYPNQSENLARMSKVVNYTPHQFQEDLLNTLGVIGTTDFVGKTFSKMGAMSSPGYKVGNLPFEVWINYSWGENQIIHDGVPMTIDEIYDEIGLGEVADYDELIDGIMDDVIYKVYIQTGFQLHFDGQI
jgi:hypothetical protein